MMRPQTRGVSSEGRSRVMMIQGSETRPRQIHFACRYGSRVMVCAEATRLITQATRMMVVRQERVAQTGCVHRGTMLAETTREEMVARVKRVSRRIRGRVASVVLKEL